MDDSYCIEALCRLDSAYREVIPRLSVLQHKNGLVGIFLYSDTSLKGRNFDVLWGNTTQRVVTHYRLLATVESWFSGNLSAEDSFQQAWQVAINIQGLLHDS